MPGTVARLTATTTRLTTATTTLAFAWPSKLMAEEEWMLKMVKEKGRKQIVILNVNTFKTGDFVKSRKKQV